MSGSTRSSRASKGVLPALRAVGALALACAVPACGQKPAEVRVTAKKSTTVSMSKIGVLSVRLEIRRLADDVTGTAWLSWSGADAATVTSQLNLYRYSTTKLSPLKGVDDSSDLDDGKSKAFAVPSVLEPERTCANLALSVSAFDADANEVVKNAIAEVCE